MADLPVPEQPIDKMNLAQLRTFVPQMLRSVNGRFSYGSEDTKPVWWPAGVPWASPRQDTRQESSKEKVRWTDVLRDIVQRCYRHHGAESRLTWSSSSGGEGPLEAPSESSSASCIHSGIITLDQKQEFFTKMPALEARVPEPVPTSGPLPAKIFAGWNKNTVPPYASLPEGGAVTTAMTTLDGLDVTFVEIFICFYCEHEFRDRQALQRHQRHCGGDASPLHIVHIPKNSRSLISQQPKVRSYKSKDVHPDTYKRADRKVFVDKIGLLPRSKLEAFNRQRNKEIKCDKIDFEDVPVPKTPTTPRSAKSLISQLSRDLSPPPSVGKITPLGVEGDAVLTLSLSYTPHKSGNCSDGDGESVCSGKSDSGESTFNPRRLTNLLAIDLCSPLGQRLKKHIDKLETSEPSEYEQYCHTPVKNNALERLRHRANPYPVTFRKNKRVSPKKCHEYKFAKRDRREFMSRLRTGLTKRGRKMKRQMKPCHVCLEPLSKETIVKWITPRKRMQVQLNPQYMMQLHAYQPQRFQHIAVPSDGTFPSGTSLLAPTNELELAKLLGLRTQADSRKGPLTMLNMDQVMSEDMQAEMHQQKAVVYKTILTDMGSRPPVYSSTSNNTAKLSNFPVLFYSNSAKASRNFGKPLQTATSTINNSMMRPHLSGSSQGFNSRNFKGGSMSKENEVFSRNQRTARHLSMDGAAKETSLDALRQLPSVVPRRKPEDDVISISSTESEDEGSGGNPNKRPALDDFQNNNASRKRRRVATPDNNRSTQVVLFRCHLCHAEITCKLGHTDFIQKHFSDRHKVNNIHLLEHTDNNNQKVVTIVEDTGSELVKPVPASRGPQKPSLARDEGTANGASRNNKIARQEIQQNDPFVHAGLDQGHEESNRTRVRRSSRLHSPSISGGGNEDCYSIGSSSGGKLLLRRDTSAIDMPAAPEIIVLD